MESKQKDTQDTIETITYPLIIKSKLWESFKATVPRTITLNEALIGLIKEKLKKEGASCKTDVAP